MLAKLLAVIKDYNVLWKQVTLYQRVHLAKKTASRKTLEQ